ncbi:putative acetyltransferase [Desulfosporosinus acidiphilus SJ4]|uniref:Putative acetyltransferase n=1 Tax=Desulfosporosinus acidiphilus (strain DSM 22704 / JCM 16185 / SJ4) TaxID=646529 RepID=I4D3Z5_DESAJ|nr:GNAT family N-acetyltransferase [Desulfosporosinus acidiphilus]AFM40519.1 putative acetyltransferase [Desulfosporosinus acidiphilus SJ4]
MSKIIIQRAESKNSPDLTLISFASKRYWNYPEEYFDVWKQELTITPDYIKNNLVYIAEVEGKITGYFSIVEVKGDFRAGKVLVRKGYWLDHLFIRPEFIGEGIGTELISFAVNLCGQKSIGRLFIFSDPNAKGFYEKIGARYIEESASSIQGRSVLLYELVI